MWALAVWRAYSTRLAGSAKAYVLYTRCSHALLVNILLLCSGAGSHGSQDGLQFLMLATPSTQFGIEFRTLRCRQRQYLVYLNRKALSRSETLHRASTSIHAMLHVPAVSGIIVSYKPQGHATYGTVLQRSSIVAAAPRSGITWQERVIHASYYVYRCMTSISTQLQSGIR